MSHSLPVFYLPIDAAELPQSTENWHSVEHLIDNRWTNRNEVRFLTTTSRNWWLQCALCLISEGLEIVGLEFAKSEIACLRDSELQIAARALDELLNRLRDGIPKLPANIEEDGSIWGLRHRLKGGQSEKYSPTEMRIAFEEAQAVLEITGADIGHESVVDFFSFVKSLRSIVRECLEERKYLLCVQPQP